MPWAGGSDDVRDLFRAAHERSLELRARAAEARLVAAETRAQVAENRGRSVAAPRPPTNVASMPINGNGTLNDGQATCGCAT